MTVRGVVRGNTIELLDSVAWPDGHEVTLKLNRRLPGRRGSAERVAWVEKHFPPVKPEDMAELSSALAEPKQPAQTKSCFDDTGA